MVKDWEEERESVDDGVLRRALLARETRSTTPAPPTRSVARSPAVPRDAAEKRQDSSYRPMYNESSPVHQARSDPYSMTSPRMEVGRRRVAGTPGGAAAYEWDVAGTTGSPDRPGHCSGRPTGADCRNSNGSGGEVASQAERLAPLWHSSGACYWGCGVEAPGPPRGRRSRLGWTRHCGAPVGVTQVGSDLRWKSHSLEVADLRECGRLVAPVTCEPPLAVPRPVLAVGQDPSCGVGLILSASALSFHCRAQCCCCAPCPSALLPLCPSPSDHGPGDFRLLHSFLPWASRCVPAYWGLLCRFALFPLTSGHLGSSLALLGEGGPDFLRDLLEVWVCLLQSSSRDAETHWACVCSTAPSPLQGLASDLPAYTQGVCLYTPCRAPKRRIGGSGTSAGNGCLQQRLGACEPSDCE